MRFARSSTSCAAIRASRRSRRRRAGRTSSRSARCSSRSSARSSAWTTRRSAPTAAVRPRSHPRRCAAGSTRAATTRAARSCCSTRATRSRSTTARSPARWTGASSDSRSFRMPRPRTALISQGKTVVSYCTGGIRCEKAALYLREEGIDAFQLDGGILGYFEHVGGDHWTGECFVFDEREALTPSSGTDRSGAMSVRPRTIALALLLDIAARGRLRRARTRKPRLRRLRRACGRRRGRSCSASHRLARDAGVAGADSRRCAPDWASGRRP